VNYAVLLIVVVAPDIRNQTDFFFKCEIPLISIIFIEYLQDVCADVINQNYFNSSRYYTIIGDIAISSIYIGIYNFQSLEFERDIFHITYRTAQFNFQLLNVAPAYHVVSILRSYDKRVYAV